MGNMHIKVYGRVQGVGFRYFTYTKAIELGLSGWVKNLADGSVEIKAVGSKELLDRFLAYIKVGPTYSEVMHTVVEVESTDVIYSRFTMG